MKKILVALVAACCLFPMAHADDAAKQAKAAKLVELMHLDTLTAQMVDTVKVQMRQAMDQAVAGNTLTVKQKAVQSNFEDKAVAMIVSEMNWDVIKPDVVKVYAETLTDEEINGMIQFYSSPVGQSVLAKMPQLTAASMQMEKARMGDLQPKMMALMQDYQAQMKAASN